MMEWVALSAGRCGSEYVEYSVTLDELSIGNIEGVKIIYLADFLLKEEY